MLKWRVYQKVHTYNFEKYGDFGTYTNAGYGKMALGPFKRMFWLNASYSRFCNNVQNSMRVVDNRVAKF
jgi:hypothetical protein